MKISKNTLNILNSFTSFNPSIYITKGNVLTTTNVGKDGNRKIPLKSVLIRAEVEETFEKDFGIYDLKQFLQIVDTFDESPDFIFGDNYVTISEEKYSIHYCYCKPNIIMRSEKEVLDNSNPDDTFIIDSKELAKLKKVSNVMKHDDLFIRSSAGDKRIQLVLTTVTEGSTGYKDEFIIEIEKENETLSDYEVRISMKYLSNIIMDNEYLLSILNNNGRYAITMEGLGKTKIIYSINSKRS